MWWKRRNFLGIVARARLRDAINIIETVNYIIGFSSGIDDWWQRATKIYSFSIYGRTVSLVLWHSLMIIVILLALNRTHSRFLSAIRITIDWLINQKNYPMVWLFDADTLESAEVSSVRKSDEFTFDFVSRRPQTLFTKAKITFTAFRLV